MQTAYDWITLAIFAGLVVLFLQRSTGENHRTDDALWMYLVAGAGCAVANYFGNNGMNLPAIVLLALILAFIAHYLRPFSRGPSA